MSIHEVSAFDVPSDTDGRVRYQTGETNEDAMGRVFTVIYKAVREAQKTAG